MEQTCCTFILKKLCQSYYCIKTSPFFYFWQPCSSRRFSLAVSLFTETATEAKNVPRTFLLKAVCKVGNYGRIHYFRISFEGVLSLKKAVLQRCAISVVFFVWKIVWYLSNIEKP